MFVDLLAEMNLLFLWGNPLVSFRNFPSKLLLVHLNCMFLSISIKSNSKFASSPTTGVYLNWKPNVFFSGISSFPRNCDAFHPILFIIFSTFDIKCSLYSFHYGTRMFFFKYSVLNLSILFDINDKVFNNNKGAFDDIQCVKVVSGRAIISIMMEVKLTLTL